MPDADPAPFLPSLRVLDHRDQLTLAAPVALAPATSRTGGPGQRLARRLIRVVSPCWNAAEDLQINLDALARLRLSDAEDPASDSGLALEVIVVDNASEPPLKDRVRVPRGLSIEFLRLPTNTGGSGGYNAGMAHALALGRRTGLPAEFIWLLDSDAAPDQDALLGLVRAMDAYEQFVAIGSSIADPATGEIFEIGGRLDPFLGQYHPMYSAQRPPPCRTSEVVYAAACSLMVRPAAIEQVGLFPDVFLNGDDVEWCVRLARGTGMKIGATQDSVVRHPSFKHGATVPRYYVARNAFGPIDALELGWRVRLTRALREVPRALAQVMVGRDDLAELHMGGLADAASGRLFGPAPQGRITFDRFEPMHRLGLRLHDLGLPRNATVWVHPRLRLSEEVACEVESEIAACGLTCPPIERGTYLLENETMFAGVGPAILRLLRGPRATVAMIPCRGRPNAWGRGRIQVEIAPGGFVIRTLNRPRVARRALWTALRGLTLALRLACRKPERDPAKRLPPARQPSRDASGDARNPAARSLAG